MNPTSNISPNLKPEIIRKTLKYLNVMKSELNGLQIKLTKSEKDKIFIRLPTSNQLSSSTESISFSAKKKNSNETDEPRIMVNLHIDTISLLEEAGVSRSAEEIFSNTTCPNVNPNRAIGTERIFCAIAIFPVSI